MAILRSLTDGEQIEITVTEELPEFNNDVTDHPVEDGFSVSDHVALRPGSLPLSGVVTGREAPGKLAILRRWRDDRHLLRYSGRNIVSNYVISDFRSEHDVTVSDGFRFRLILKQVRIVKPAVVELVAPDPVANPVAGRYATSAQIKAIEDRGRQQVTAMVLGQAIGQPAPAFGFAASAINVALDYISKHPKAG